MKKILLVGALAFFSLAQGHAVPVENVESTEQAQSQTRFVEVLKNNVNVRKAPKTGAPVMKATMGQTFQLVSTSNGWHEIRLENGDTAYISAAANLTALTSCQTIPTHLLKEFSGLYCADFANYGMTNFGTDMELRDGYVYINREVILVDQSTGRSLSYLNIYNLGVIENNRIVCTKQKVAQFPDFSLCDMTPEDFEDMENGERFIIDYSPLKKQFFVEGNDISPW